MTSKIYLRGGSLDDCDLSDAAMCCAHFEGVSMLGANFTRADLKQSEFYLVLGMNSNFDHSQLQQATFLGGSFEDADFIGSDLTGASFLADNMGGYVDLSGANFTDSKLDQTVFGSAVYSEQTKFPDGFNPLLAGLKIKSP